MAESDVAQPGTPIAGSTQLQPPEDSAAAQAMIDAFASGEEHDFGESYPVIYAATIRALLLEEDRPTTAELRIKRATIVGDLRLTGCKDVPLFALKDCSWKNGAVFVNFAKLRSMWLDGTELQYIDGTRCEVEGSIYLRHGFVAAAGVNFSGAWIKGTLTIRGGTLGMGYEKKRRRLPAEATTRLDDTAYALRLVDARIEGRLMLADPRNRRLKEQAVLLGSVELRGLEATEFLDHRHNYQAIDDAVSQKGRKPRTSSADQDPRRLPVPTEILEQSRLHLEGFTYKRLSVEAETNGEYRCRWLRSFRPEDDEIEILRFRTHAYSQLARALHELGLDDEAKKVLIERDRRQFLINESSRGPLLAPVRRLWNASSRFLAGYGYRPGNLHLFSLGLVIAAAIGLRFAWLAGALAPASGGAAQTAWWKACAPAAPIPVPKADILSLRTAPVAKCLAERDSLQGSNPDYPRFRPSMYALDVYLPVVDLKQEEFWVPAERLGMGRTLSWWLIALRAAGWFYVSFAIASLFQSLTKRGSS